MSVKTENLLALVRIEERVYTMLASGEPITKDVINKLYDLREITGKQYDPANQMWRDWYPEIE